MKNRRYGRRAFLGRATTSAAIASCFPASLAGIEREVRTAAAGTMERRSLGRTGARLSILGFGGLVVTDATTEQAAQRVRDAFERGINYFDVAPRYGNAEQMLGPALEPYRKEVFLACKTAERDRAGAARELEQSLQRLRTDHFDLYQFHAVTRPEEVEQILGPNGALEAFVAAREAGKVRFLGFSAHSVEAALAMMDGFDFDTILFPVNWASWHEGNFGPQVLELAQKKKMGILALKATAREPVPRGEPKPYRKCWYQPMTDPEEALMGLRFTLSHPVTSALPAGDENLFRMALGLADRITPLSGAEVLQIKERALRSAPIFRYPRQA